MASDAKIEQRTRLVGDNVVVHTLERTDVVSENVTIFLHGLGLDASDYVEYMSHSGDRGVAITLYGFDARRGPGVAPVTMATHASYLAQLIADLKNEHPVGRLTLVGFSLGADLIFRLAEYWQEHPSLAPEVWGAVLLDPNVNFSTMTISRIFAELDPANPLDKLRQVSALPTTLPAFQGISSYLSKITLKDFAHIHQMSRDVLAYWEPAGNYGLVNMRIAQLCQHATHVRLVLSGDYQEHVDSLPTSCAGGTLSTQVLPGAGHFDLISNDVIDRAIRALR